MLYVLSCKPKDSDSFFTRGYPSEDVTELFGPIYNVPGPKFLIKTQFLCILLSAIFTAARPTVTLAVVYPLAMSPVLVSPLTNAKNLCHLL